jgi:hypothetical protein
VSVRIVSPLFVVACLVGVTPRLFAGGEPGPSGPAASRQGKPASPAPAPAQVAAIGELPADEMLRTPAGRWERWTAVPELVVLTSVMHYHSREATEYRATDEPLRDKDLEELVADMTIALSELTGQTVVQFAAVHREPIAPGQTVPIMQPGRIVAGRYRGVRDVTRTLGFGGRQTRRDGTITAGAVVLDAEFDRTSTSRQLSRMHELGHALGFNHVTARTSVMNAHIGTAPTEVDRRLARLAFSRALGRD